MRSDRELTAEQLDQLISQLSPERRESLWVLRLALDNMCRCGYSPGKIRMTANLMRQMPPKSAGWN